MIDFLCIYLPFLSIMSRLVLSLPRLVDQLTDLTGRSNGL